MRKIKIGIDFDNTIVDYSNLFGKIAFDKNLIKNDRLIAFTRNADLKTAKILEQNSDSNNFVYKIDVESKDLFFANGIVTHNAKGGAPPG